MGKKSRKKRQQMRQTQSSAAQAAGGGFGALKDTLSRLATTVRADAKTVMTSGKVAPGGTVRNDGLYSKLVEPAAKSAAPVPSRLSSFAAALNPLQHLKAAVRRADTNRKLGEVAKGLAQQSSPAMKKVKVRRSRLPHLVAFLALCAGGGLWYAYESVTLPEINVSQYLDYDHWLNVVSGNGSSEATATADRKSSGGRTLTSAGAVGGGFRKPHGGTASAVRPATERSARINGVAAPGVKPLKIKGQGRTGGKLKGKAAASGTAKAAKAGKSNHKSKAKVGKKTAQQRAWDAKLAKLRRQAEAERKARRSR